MNFDAGSDQYESSLCILVQILMLHDLHIYILNFCDKTLKLSYNSAASLKVKKYLLFFISIYFCVIAFVLNYFWKQSLEDFELGVLIVASWNLQSKALKKTYEKSSSFVKL